MKPIYLYIAVFVLAVINLHQCNNADYLEDSRDSYKAYVNDTVDYYRNKEGKWEAEKSALRGDKENLELLLSKQVDSTGELRKLVEELRTTDAAGRVVTETRIDSIFVPYQGKIEDTERTFRVKTRYYSLSGQETINGFNIHSLSIPNTMSFAIGKKKGLFNNRYTITAVNSNPYVKTTGLDAYTFQEKRKRFGVGPFVGMVLTPNLGFAPSFGIGISYDLIRF